MTLTASRLGRTPAVQAQTDAECARAEFLSLYHEANNLAAVALASARAIQYRGHVNSDPVAVQVGCDLEAVASRFRRQNRELPR